MVGFETFFGFLILIFYFRNFVFFGMGTGTELFRFEPVLVKLLAKVEGGLCAIPFALVDR